MSTRRSQIAGQVKYLPSRNAPFPPRKVTEVADVLTIEMKVVCVSKWTDHDSRIGHLAQQYWYPNPIARCVRRCAGIFQPRPARIVKTTCGPSHVVAVMPTPHTVQFGCPRPGCSVRDRLLRR